MAFSKKPGKKLDVFKHGKRVASIGARGYSDYLLHGDEARRARYKKRHERDRHRVGSPGFYADQILW